MKKPYSIPFAIPFCLLCDFLVKKVTVTGTIGKTQGVSNAINTPRNTSRKIFKIPLPFVPSSPQGLSGLLISIEAILILVVDSTPPSREIVKGTLVEG